MIRGMHAMFYSSQAAELRAFLRDKLGLPFTDVGDGWLIFDVPEADLGVHPTGAEGAGAAGGAEGAGDRAPFGTGDGPASGAVNGPSSGTADISFYCDDIEGTVAELKARGVVFTRPVEDHGYGLVTYMSVPGGFTIQLYQPRYLKAK